MASLDVSLRLRLINGLSAPAKEAAKDLQGIGEAAKKISGGAGGLTAMGTATARFGHELGRVTVSAGRADASLRQLGAERAGIAGLDAVTRALNQDLTKVGSAATTAEAGLRRLGSDRAGLAGLDAVARSLAQDMRAVGSAADQSSRSIERMNRTAARARTGASVAGADLALAGRPDLVRRKKGDGLQVGAPGNQMIGGLIGGVAAAGAYKQAAAFDRRMTMIGQTAEASRVQIDALGASVHNLAQETATPVDKLAGGLETLVAQGRNLKEALDFMPAVARTAAASGSEVDDIAKSADSVGTNFDIAGKRMQAAFDIMAAGGKAGQFELKDMARYLPSLSPAAKAQGFKGEKGLADIVAMLQTIRKGSGTSEEAAVSMTNIFQKLNSEETSKNFKKMGVDLEAALKKGRTEGRNLVEVLEEATQQATKGDLSLMPKLFKDQEFGRGMLALMTYRGEWQKLSETLQTTSGGTVMRDIVQVTNDAQASLDRLSNSWARFTQGASRTADATGVSSDLSKLGSSLQGIGSALERVNEAYAKGGLSGVIKQAAGDFRETVVEERKNALDAHAKSVGGGIVEIEADNKAFREKLLREGRSQEDIASTMRLREEAVEKARRRLGFLERAKDDPRLAKGPPPSMLADPIASPQGKAGPVGIGTVEFQKAYPLELGHRVPASSPLPPKRPSTLPTIRTIDRIDDVLGPGDRGRPARDVSFETAGDPGLRPQMEGAMRALAARQRAMERRTPSFGLEGVPSAQGADAGIAPKLGGAGAFPLAADLKKIDFSALKTGVDGAIEDTKRLRTGLSQDLSEPARESIEKYKTALKAGVDQAVAIAAAGAAQIRASLSFTATPTISPTVAPRAAGGAPGAAATPVRATPAGGGGAPRLQTASRGGGDLNIHGPVHLHGVSDTASLRRAFTREADAGAREERDSRLHDSGSYYS